MLISCAPLSRSPYMIGRDFIFSSPALRGQSGAYIAPVVVLLLLEAWPRGGRTGVRHARDLSSLQSEARTRLTRLSASGKVSDGNMRTEQTDRQTVLIWDTNPHTPDSNSERHSNKIKLRQKQALRAPRTAGARGYGTGVATGPLRRPGYGNSAQAAAASAANSTSGVENETHGTFPRRPACFPSISL